MTKRLFVSVGSRLPMDRLLKSVDDFLEQHSDYAAFAQIGPSKLSLKHLQSTRWLNEREFEKALLDCDVFVSHAGMGNIIMASKYDKPIVVMPRRFELGEHINDHQLATVNGLRRHPNMLIVNREVDVEQAILTVSKNSSVDVTQQTDFNSERKQLIENLKHFIDNATV